MEPITIKLAEAADFEAAAALLFPSAREPLAKGGIVLLAYRPEGAEPCGALGALAKEGILEVCSLYVKEEMRHAGIGAALVRQAEAEAKNAGFSQIAFSYGCTAEQALQLDGFFLKNGYPLPLCGDTMFTVALAELKESAFMKLIRHAKPSSHIIPLRHLKKEQLAALPPFLAPNAAAGVLLDELCLGYLWQGRLTALVLFADTDGVLHLNSAYLAEKAFAPHLMSLLKQALDTIEQKYAHFQSLTVTGGTQNGYELIQKLLEGAPVARTMLYMTSKGFSPMQSDFMPPDFSAAMVRFQSYAELLAEQGIGSELVLPNGGMPYLELPCAEEIFGLYYDISDEAEEMDFAILAEYCFPPLEESLRDEILGEIREKGAPYYALLSDAGGDILFRARFEEGADSVGFDAEGGIREFILPFRNYLDGLMQKYHWN